MTAPRASVYYRVAAALLDAALVDARTAVIKAGRVEAQRHRAKAITAALDPMIEELAAYFEGMAARIAVAKAVAREPDLDWTDERRRLREVIGRWYLVLGEEAYGAAADELAADVPWSTDQPGVQAVIDTLAQHVRDITDNSRAQVRRQVATAVDRGYSLDQLVRGVEDDAFEGLRSLVKGWASTPQGRAGSRAALIAVTETATAYSQATLGAYRDSGVVKQVQVFDGPDCGWRTHDDSDKANGSLRDLDDAADHPIAHPRCSRAFGPVTS